MTLAPRRIDTGSFGTITMHCTTTFPAPLLNAPVVRLDFLDRTAA